MVDSLSKGKSITPLLTKETPEPDPVTDSRRIRPIIELLDIHVDGTAGIEITPSEPFVKIARVIVFHSWEGTQLDYFRFMGAGPLLVGLQLTIDNRPLFPDGILAMQDYMRYSFDTDVVIDTLGADKRIYFTARLSFHKFMGNLDGIDVRDYKVAVPLFEDISAFGVNSSSTWAFEGWGWDR